MKFPFFYELKDKRILMVGAGNIAQRRFQVLDQYGAEIHVYAEEFSKQIQTKTSKMRKFEKRKLSHEDVSELLEELKPSVCLFLTDSIAWNTRAADLAQESGVMLINTSNVPEKNTFHFPTILTLDHFQIALMGDGKSHKELKRMREKIQDFLQAESMNEEKE